MPDLGLEVLFLGQNFARLLEGLANALFIALTSVGLSIPLGVLFGFFMTVNSRLVRFLCRVYLEIVRIMPQLVLLFLVFFGSSRVFGADIDGTAASIIVFTFWGTAEMGDLVRASLISIPVHQYESARALGFSQWQIRRLIVLPQALQRLIPLAINLVTRMVKTTSLVLMIGVVEVIKVGQQIIEASRMTSPNAAFGVYLVIFVFYFLACWPFSLLADRLEKKWK